MIYLDNANTVCDFRRRPIDPHNARNVNLLVQSDTSSGVDKVVNGLDIGRLPSHLLKSVLEIDSGSTHRKGELGIVVRGRVGCGFRRRDNTENLWCVGGLDPKHLTVRRVVGLDQELHRIDLCGTPCSIYARRKGNKQENRRTFTASIPGLVPIEGGDGSWGNIGKECRATNVGKDGVSNKLGAPTVLQSSDALNGQVETPREIHETF